MRKWLLINMRGAGAGELPPFTEEKGGGEREE
jgi:hypothetical protein